MQNNLFLILLALSFFTFSQKSLAQIGIKAGPGVSDITFLTEGQTPYLGAEISDLDHRIPLFTFQAGAFGKVAIWKNFYLQPELLFVTKGLDYSTEYLFDDITYKVKINYLQAPLLLKYQTAAEQKRHLGFLLGPYGSWKLKAVKVTKIEGQREKVNMSNVKDFDFGIIAGLSYDFDLQLGSITIDLQTGYSLINMMDRVEGYIPWYYGPSRAYARNVSISLTVGYEFLNMGSNKKEKS